MKLFVDCDDTLVLWQYIQREDGLYFATPWQANDNLIAAIKGYYRERQDLELIIWSGGGVEYADRWANRFFPSIPYTVVQKDMHLPQEGDICIDDMEIAVNCTTILPAEFVDAFFSQRGQ